MPLTTLVDGNVITAAGLNANFAVCVLTDTAKTITVTHTWSAAQTFTGGFTTGAAATIGGLLTLSNSGQLLVRTGASTSAQYFDLGNTSGRALMGIEGSVASIIAGATAYDTAITGAAGISLSGDGGTTRHVRISNVGALTVAGVVSKTTASQSVNDGATTTALDLPSGLFFLTGTVTGTAGGFSALVNIADGGVTTVAAMANITPSISGGDLIITNNTGGTKTINYNVIRLL